MKIEKFHVILPEIIRKTAVFMPKIYDNIERHLSKGLNETLDLSQRTDFCVGYFNLRGWKEVADKIDGLSGMTVTEGHVNSIDSNLKEKLIGLGKELQDDYQNNSHNIVRIYSKKGRTFIIEKQHFFIKLSKPIIDEIDVVLAKHYGFTEEELDFIINYDIKYRIGKELNEEEGEE